MILGWNNLLTGATLSASSEATGMPVTNLQDDVGSSSVAWQTIAGVTSATLTVTPTLAGGTWRVFGIFGTNLTNSGSMTVALYTNPSTLVWTGSVDGVVAGYNQLVLDAGANYSADYAIITIADTGNPDTFLNIPLAYLGPAWVPDKWVGPGWSSTFGRDHSTSEMKSRGGQEYPTFWWSRRYYDLAARGISGSDLWAEAQEADRVSRMGVNVLFIPDETSTNILSEAVFGRMEVTASFSYADRVLDRFACAYRIKERI